MKLYMFRTVRLFITRSLFTVQSTMVYVIQVCRQLWGRNILVLLESCLQTCMMYTIVECTVNKLLMMDRRTVRNMTKCICEIGAPNWFYYKEMYSTWSR